MLVGRTKMVHHANDVRMADKASWECTKMHWKVHTLSILPFLGWRNADYKETSKICTVPEHENKDFFRSCSVTAIPHVAAKGMGRKWKIRHVRGNITYTKTDSSNISNSARNVFMNQAKRTLFLISIACVLTIRQWGEENGEPQPIPLSTTPISVPSNYGQTLPATAFTGDHPEGMRFSYIFN